MRIETAKKKIQLYNSLVKVAKSLGFHLSDEFCDAEYEFIATINGLKKYIPTMLELNEISGFRKKYLLWTLKDMNEVETFIAAIAMSKGMVLDLDNNEWILCKPEKI